MRSPKRIRARGNRTSRKRTDVGYCRPPVEHQFKPGQSGNKRGRPKGSKSEATILNELLSRKININQNGTTRRISVLEGMSGWPISKVTGTYRSRSWQAV